MAESAIVVCSVVVPKGEIILNLSKGGIKLRKKGRKCVFREDLKIDLGEIKEPFLLLV